MALLVRDLLVVELFPGYAHYVFVKMPKLTNTSFEWMCACGANLYSIEVDKHFMFQTLSRPITCMFPCEKRSLSLSIVHRNLGYCHNLSSFLVVGLKVEKKL